jgi:hypothetical protein
MLQETYRKVNKTRKMKHITMRLPFHKPSLVQVAPYPWGISPLRLLIGRSYRVSRGDQNHEDRMKFDSGFDSMRSKTKLCISTARASMILVSRRGGGECGCRVVTNDHSEKADDKPLFTERGSV